MEILEINKLNDPNFLDNIIEHNFITYHTCTDICNEKCYRFKNDINIGKTYLMTNVKLNYILNYIYFNKKNKIEKKILDININCLIITLDQEITEDIINIMKQFTIVLFAGFTGKINTPLPDNIKMVIISGDGNHVIPYLNNNLLSLFIIDKYQSNRDKDKDIVVNNYKLEYLPDSIKCLCLPNNFESTLQSYPKQLESLFIFSFTDKPIIIEKLQEGIQNIFTNSYIYLNNCPDSLYRYCYFNSDIEKKKFNIDHLKFKNLKLLEIFEEIDVKTLYKLPNTLIKLLVNCTIETIGTGDYYICPFPNLKLLTFIDNSWIFSNKFFETSNIENIIINKDTLKYLNSMHLGSKCKEVILYNISEDNTEDTDDEFYEETFNVKFPSVEPIENNTEQIYPLNKGIYQRLYTDYNSEKSRQKRKYKTWIEEDIKPLKKYKCKMTHKIDKNEYNKLIPINRKHYIKRKIRKITLKRKLYYNIVRMLLSKGIKFTYKNISKDLDFTMLNNFYNI